LKDYTNSNVVYNVAKENEGFDCFIPPNNFIGFTQMSQPGEKAGAHPISLNFALKCCKLIEGPINFITAVPTNQTKNWGQQRFQVNVKEVVDKINASQIEKGETKHLFQRGGQRTFNSLPPSTQNDLKHFRQFVGGVAIKRRICTSVFRQVGASSLVRVSVISLFKYVK
jgi:hypothetical protein